MENWIHLDWKDNEYVRFVCAYYARVTEQPNLILLAHDYDSQMLNVGVKCAVDYLAEAFDYFCGAYDRLYCMDFPGAYDRVAYAVNVAID